MSKAKIGRMISFAFIGGGVLLAGQAVLYGLVEALYWNAMVANTIIQAVSVAVNYKLNRRYTWKHPPSHAQAQRFVFSRAMTLLLSLALFNIFLRSGMHYMLASVIGIAIGTIVNFEVADRWVFNRSKHRTVKSVEELALNKFTVAIVALTLTGVVAATWVWSPHQFLPLLMVYLSVVAMGAISLFTVSLLYTHRHHESHASMRLRTPTGSYQERFAVLMPARHETEVLGPTILNAFWTQGSHPAFRLLPVLCDDDPDTIRVAIAAAKIANNTEWVKGLSLDAARLNDRLHKLLSSVSFDGSPLSKDEYALIEHWRSSDALTQIIIYPMRGRKSSKPKQLNFAFRLLRDRGFTAFTILDAESIAQPNLLRFVDQAFQDHPGVTVIQGPVQLMDPTYRGSRLRKLMRYCRRWYSWHNLLEYHRWFSGQMAFQSSIRFVPLGGNTLFVRTPTLVKTNGWPETLTEDCALGIRVSGMVGEKVLTFCDPTLATREETPPSVGDLVRQRTRWTQGFIQSFVAGEWRAMDTHRQRLMALWILSGPFLQAVAAPLLPLAVLMTTMGFFKSPPLLVLVMYLPLLTMVVVTILQLKQLHEYGVQYGRKVAWYVYVQVVVTQFPYQLLLSYAAMRAVARHTSGKENWESPARAGDLLVAREPLGETS